MITLYACAVFRNGNSVFTSTVFTKLRGDDVVVSDELFIGEVRETLGVLLGGAIAKNTKVGVVEVGFYVADERVTDTQRMHSLDLVEDKDDRLKGMVYSDFGNADIPDFRVMARKLYAKFQELPVAERL